MNFSPFAFGLASTVLNDAGASFKFSASTNFVLIAACGHADAQIPHCKQNSAFQCGTLGAIPRFSRQAVPVGITPSTDIAETGISSPFCLIEGSIIFLAKSDASSEINLTTSACATPSNDEGTSTSSQASTAASINAMFILTTSSPFFLNVFFVISFIPSSACSNGMIPETLKYATIITVFAPLPRKPGCDLINFSASIL